MVPRGLSVVIPAYNEERRLPRTLEAVKRYCTERLASWEIIVVDDGSTDATLALARQFAERHLRVRVIANGVNLGKGASIRIGMQSAAEPLVLMTDADLSTPIEELDKLVALLGPADVAIGSRALPGAHISRHQPIYRELMGKAFNRFVRALALERFRDTQCGFKLFKQEAARAIFSRARIDRFAFDVEAIFIAEKLGLTVVEAPVRWHNSPQSSVHIVRDSLRMLLDLCRIRWMHRSRLGQHQVDSLRA